MGVGGEAGAADLADGVVREDLDGVGEGADAVSLEGLHVEDVDALNLAHELETLNTGGLLLAVRVSVSLEGCVAPVCSDPPLVIRSPIIPPDHRSSNVQTTFYAPSSALGDVEQRGNALTRSALDPP